MQMTVTYTGLLAPPPPTRAERIAWLLTQPQYEPQTKHHFFGGLYCREVYRDAGALVVGRVHRKEHFYQIVSGSVMITQDDGKATRVDAPALLKSSPGTNRTVLSLEPTVCMTWHATKATTPEEAEAELLEPEEVSAYDAHNRVKPEYLTANLQEVLS